MPWYRLAFQAGVVQDLTVAGPTMAQRLLEKTKWIASNVDNLRHEVIDDIPGLHKYDRGAGVVDIHAVVHKRVLKQ